MSTPFLSTVASQARQMNFMALLTLAQAQRLGMGGATKAQFERAVCQEAVKSICDQASRQKTLRGLVSAERLVRRGLARALPDPGGPVNQASPVDDRLVLTDEGRRQLLAYVFDLLPAPGMGRKPGAEAAERNTESRIALAALLVLARLQHDLNDTVPTQLLRETLLEELPLHNDDRQPLKNRSDTKIDQVIRNLISHNTLTTAGWAQRTDEQHLCLAPEGQHKLLDLLLPEFPAPDFSTATPSAPRRRRKSAMA